MPMKSRTIRAWLMMHGIPQAQIARELGVNTSTVCLFIDGRTTSRRLYLYFTRVLGVPRRYFGEKYGDEEAA